jgi:2-amino-4-hydroxy-6-hydroxymethyldihydropteridine diphosphokinase
MAGVGEAHTVYLSVGSNLGDKLENCVKGITALAAGAECEWLAGSRFYRTSPVDYADQDWFVNAAVKIATRLKPFDLLKKLIYIQSQMGRKNNGIRFGPRTLDLDILLYDQRVIRTADLEIPHPRMHKRVFVLQPICDINPAIIHPVLGMTAADLLKQLDAQDQQVVPMRSQPEWPQGGTP